MNKQQIKLIIGIVGLVTILNACGIPKVTSRDANREVPEQFVNGNQDSTNIADIIWKDYFHDKYLIALIDTALLYNQELNITLQEINVYNNEILARKGEYLPFVDIGAGGGVEKVGRYTSQGANDANTEIAPGKETPDPLGDVFVGAFATWEIDIWRKLRNSRDAAVNRYLATVEGKNFMVTNLVAEVASSYYELLALDSQLKLLQEYIKIQNNALKTVKIQKEAGESTELAVKRFEAEVLKTQAKQFDIKQQIVETENKINFLLGRYPQHIERSEQSFEAPITDSLMYGVPSQLLENRPDIKAAELEITASKLDVKVAKAKFYPSLDITAGVGMQAFNPAYFIKAPESMLYNLAGDLMAPVINRKAIKAEFLSANAEQLQAVYDYEKTVLTAYIEVYNQLSNIDNLNQSYSLKNQEVTVLNQSIVYANGLFTSAKADYMEVLITQRDALDARFELIEYKLMQFNAMIHLYQALGGGWK
ncbi:TolC family protein [Paracrocinitomix mangrovi]|uniref:TolC family protein n=1 Tax=Paracrocinitomix mangrovi TaxID=2862509 RepID=UPI001C8F03B9|nr:TolC family protein [Paracrocinitomix mangrovi]UKN01964.1 TolC family protein [Paracrocinitomix mangrovi]